MMDTLMQDDANNVIDDDAPHDNPTMRKRVKADSQMDMQVQTIFQK
jgi:hypothetical protein